MDEEKRTIILRMAEKFVSICSPEDKGRAITEMTAFEAGFAAGKEVAEAEQKAG